MQKTIQGLLLEQKKNNPKNQDLDRYCQLSINIICGVPAFNIPKN